MAIVSRLGCSSMTTAKGDLLTAPDGMTARHPLRPNLDGEKASDSELVSEREMMA